MVLDVLSIPSPAEGTWYLGPLPLRGYALSIIAGIVAAIWIAERRWVARGGEAGEIQDLAIWAVPFGLVGARAYHVATDAGRYFGDGGNPWEALYLWKGGLGVWGGIAMGALGVYLGARAKGIRIAPVLDAIAPGVLVAQALGRWGNWFNQELYGRPTDLPWGLSIDVGHRPAAHLAAETFHPTFLYEGLWNLTLATVLVRVDRRGVLKPGYLIGLWVCGYGLGRLWVESLRIDHASLLAGVRVNIWVSLVAVVVGGAVAVAGRNYRDAS